MVQTTMLTITAAMLIAVGMLRLRAYRTVRRPETGYLAVGLLAFGLSLAGNIEPVVRALDGRLWHYPNATILASHMCALLCSMCSVELVARSARGDRPRERRIRTAAFILVGAAMVTTFVLVGERRELPALFAATAHSSAWRLYWPLLIGAMSAATAYVAVIAHRSTRHDDDWLRRGLSMIAVGATLACAFLGVQGIALFATVPAWMMASSLAALGCGGALIAVGAVVPDVAVRRELSAAARELRPVWAAVTARYPHVRATDTPTSLYRLVIEIEDAIAEARFRREIAGALLIALNDLPARPSDELGAVIQDLRRAALAVGGTERG